MERAKPRTSLVLLVFAVAFAALALHTRRFLPFISDDALISLTYAKRLAQGHGLTWNGGLLVEGYSNLLWVLANAALGALGLDVVDAARLLGFAGMGAALAAVVYAYPPSNLKTALPALLALLFLSLSGAFPAWAVGGLEQPFLAGLLAWAVVLAAPRIERPDAGAREMLLPGLLFALLCLTRLDGPVFTAAAVASVFLCRGVGRESLRKAFGLAVLPVLFVLGHELFRLSYYGEWLPNTARVKFHPSGKHALDGLAYLGKGALPAAPFLALAGAAAFVCLRRGFSRARVILPLASAAAWFAYVATIGGDIFPAWRHYVPIFLMLAFVVAEGGAHLARRAPARKFAAAMLAGALALGLFAYLQYEDDENFRAISERWEWDAEVIGNLLKKAFAAEQPLLAVDPAGGLPFWSELPAVDMLGLNDLHLPRHPPPDLGQGPIAHEMGDGKYVLDRRPDLVVFLLPTGSEHGYFLSGRQMTQDPRFHRDYTLVRFEGREPYRTVSQIWVRKESERIGIRREPGRVTVPGFLFRDYPGSAARLGREGRLVVPVAPGLPARLQNFELPAGRWRVEADASGLPVRLIVSGSRPGRVGGDADGHAPPPFDAQGPVTLLDAQTPSMFEWSGGGSLHVELWSPAGETVEVHKLTFTRVDG